MKPRCAPLIDLPFPSNQIWRCRWPHRDELPRARLTWAEMEALAQSKEPTP